MSAKNRSGESVERLSSGDRSFLGPPAPTVYNRGWRRGRVRSDTGLVGTIIESHASQIARCMPALPSGSRAVDCCAGVVSRYGDPVTARGGGRPS